MFAIMWSLSVFLIGAQKCVVSLDSTFVFFFDSLFDGGGKEERTRFTLENYFGKNWGGLLTDVGKA